MAENEQNRPDSYYVSQVEPEAKPPPALETGILKWMRDNLFNSIFNTVLTIVGLVLVIYTINALATWVVRDANWFHVSANFRNYMLGRYESEFEWRASWTLFYSVFAIGIAIAVWIRQIARTMLTTMVVIILLVQVMPRIVNPTLDLPVWYTAAGNVEVSVAQTTESAIPNVAFIGQEGESISISLATEVSTDEDLSAINGFMDSVSNTLRNQAGSRLELIDELNTFEQLIDQQDSRAPDDPPVVTASQYDEYVAELEAGEVPEPVMDAYDINSVAVMVEVLDSETLEPIASATLEDSDDVLSFTLPADGWYVLSKSLVETESQTISLLAVQGITPVSALESTQSLQFTRRPDGFQVVDIQPPELEGEEIAVIDIIRNQYRGDRPFNDYLRTYVAPFLLNISNYVTLVLLTGVVGYVLAEIIRNSNGMQAASTLATYALGAVPVVVWILINGMFINSVMMWLIFLSVGLVAYLIYKLIQKNGYSQIYLLVAIAVYAGMVAVLLLTQGFDLPRLLTILPLLIDDAAVPRFLVWISLIFLLAAVNLGRAAHIPGEEVKINVPLIGGLAAILFAIGAGSTLGGFVNVNTEWALQPSDPRGWGGFLLTIMLTIYGIIIAFPIGVGLALGRRSDLPLIKYLCTAYIELVRGSPFITVLFFMQLFIPLLNSDFNQIPGSYRAIAATIAFSAAYLAENVRGGLQSLPPGQTEAAKALGLNAWQTVSLITMPQALRAVIPALVGQFISLFKDTSLVVIVGLIDLVGFVNTVVVQAEFIGTRLEGLLFISILYFVFSYVMSYVSRLLEASGSGSTRRM